MKFSIQPHLETEKVDLYPLKEEDFEEVYAAAADPKVWEQHPSKDRWKKDVFKVFFDGAIQSKGAFRVVDKFTGKIVGSTRFYDYNPSENSIFIGYTFYSVDCWGKGINPVVKAAMLNYIFQYVEKVYFQIGADNVRSQIAIGRIGAEKVGEEEVSYFGESSSLNYIYEISKEKWEVYCSSAKK
ncbi:GNAT family N-acetyltransferase [Chryseobacterium sp. 1B4]